jgi:glutathione peroxidase
MVKALCGIFLLAAAMSGASVHDFTLPSIDGEAAPLSQYKGKTLLIVNVASKCGFTGQYSGLQELYEKYKDRGLVVLGFPANNFGGQEPGSNSEIKQFCSRTYNVTFPMYAKISVQGQDQADLYKYLTTAGGEVKWNFTKFVLGPDGQVVQKFDSSVDPLSDELTAVIEKTLGN